MTLSSSILADYAAGRLDWSDAREVEAAATEDISVASAILDARKRVWRVRHSLRVMAENDKKATRYVNAVVTCSARRIS